VADPFVAEIRVFPFNFAPKGWAFCDGQLLPLSQNTALFSLLGTTYGGDGKVTFALPNLQGRAPVHPTGAAPFFQGQVGGTETVTLLESELPAHLHPAVASSGDGNERTPGGQLPATGIAIGQYAAAGSTPMSIRALAPTGGSQPHNNMQPYLMLSFCIALQGVFPPRL
jgi:microcystin-dependent protein